MTIKRIDQLLLKQLGEQARNSERRRAHHNLHPELDDPTQRLCVAIEPNSYIQPHRHANPAKWEILHQLSGTLVVLCFDDKGVVTERIELDGNNNLGIELPSGCWHTLAALEPESAFLEIKKGPYVATIDKDFAAWAPTEKMSQTAQFLAWYKTAKPGDSPPSLTS